MLVPTIEFSDERLANGLRLIVAEDHLAPVAAVNVWYAVGSKHEQPGKTGFAHLFEHVMFQGSRHVAKAEHIALVQAAGGLKDDASLSEVSLDVPVPGASLQTQRVDINRADVWLLQALPGIGETLANRIVDYRQQNGPFRHTSELTGVSGIGETLYEKIEDLITISD